MKYLFWSIALSLFIVSCTKVSKEDSGLTVYPVNLEQAEEIDFHNAVDSFFYVPLETADSNLLGEITQIKIDSMIAVADERRGTLQTYWRSLKVPWNNPILAKDSTYPIQEEWNISNAM